jgi:tetratricopeptide (TPR) repeat protein
LALALILAACTTPPPVRTRVASLETLEAATDSGVALPRPRLPTGVDTNAAAAYYDWVEPAVRSGVKLDTAEMALYWASRLDPYWPDPVYARALVILRAAQGDAFETWFKTRSVGATERVRLTPRQMQLVDSLMRLAWARNPFLYTNLEFMQPVRGRAGDPARTGWFAYATRRFASAESLFALALRKRPNDVGLRVYRAKALFYLHRYDSAVAELMAARDSVRRPAEARLSPVLPSVEMFDYAIGIARVQQDDFPAARVAFGRALTENLGFYWAHARLAGTALALADTATALAELALAVDLEAQDPVLRLYHGVLLYDAGRLTEAAGQLEKALELDPYYAAPHYRLARVYQAQGKKVEATEHYRLFLAHAARGDVDRHSAVRALTALGAAPADSGP